MLASLAPTPVSWVTRLVNLLGYQVYKAWVGFPFNTVQSWDRCVERPRSAARAPLHQLVGSYARYQAVAVKLVVFSWDLGLAFVTLLIELLVITYKITLRDRLKLGMVQDQDEKEESTVPELIKESGYEVSLIAINMYNFSLGYLT